jgi:hypothetical protein
MSGMLIYFWFASVPQDLTQFVIFYLGIVYQVRCVQLVTGDSLYCVWVSRDPERSTELSHCTVNESYNSNESHADLPSPVNSSLQSASTASSVGGKLQPVQVFHTFKF